MKLIINFIANIALVVIAIHLIIKFYHFAKARQAVFFDEWLFLLASISMAFCGFFNLLMKSNPIKSEVVLTITMVVLLYLLLRKPKSIANILENDFTGATTKNRRKAGI